MAAIRHYALLVVAFAIIGLGAGIGLAIVTRRLTWLAARSRCLSSGTPRRSR